VITPENSVLIPARSRSGAAKRT